MKRVLTMFFSHFFADEGLYPAAGVPSAGYFILITTTFFCIITALNHTLQLSYEKIRRIIRWIVGVLWSLEVIKIRYRFYYGNGENLNTWVSYSNQKSYTLLEDGITSGRFSEESSS